MSKARLWITCSTSGTMRELADNAKAAADALDMANWTPELKVNGSEENDCIDHTVEGPVDIVLNLCRRMAGVGLKGYVVDTQDESRDGEFKTLGFEVQDWD